MVPGAVALRLDRTSNVLGLSLWFDHGLGDCSNFAHILELYRRRGWRINLHCADDKAIVFAPVSPVRVESDHEGLEYVGYPEPCDPLPEFADNYLRYNKAAINLALSPLPDIGSSEDLWAELCSLELDGTSHVGEEHWRSVAEFVSTLERPIVLLHSMGNTSQDLKNIPRDTTIDLYRQLLDRIGGTLVLLDWDDRVPRIASWRVRHMTDDWKWIEVETLIALLDRSDLLISIDSGPLHLARMTKIPVIGLFPTINKYPARVSLPRTRTVNIVPRDLTHELNKKTRLLFNIVESYGEQGFDPVLIADVASRMLQGPRYLKSEMIGCDLQLQQFVLDWEKGRPNNLSDYNDRHKGFDLLLREISLRFNSPVIVETGCIRSPEDWRGAGYATYLLAAYTHRHGGRVTSVDIDPSHCEFARRATREAKSVTVVNEDSVMFLKRFGAPIDVLLLDSMDTEIPGHQEHALSELQTAMPLLHSMSIVVMDDTVYRSRAFTGKGALAVPWLLEQGWKILHSGYQTICVQQESGTVKCES